MSSAPGQTAQQLRQDIQHELTTANQLARLMWVPASHYLPVTCFLMLVKEE